MQPPWCRTARRTATLAALAALAIGLAPAAASAGTASTAAQTGHGHAPDTRFYVPPPADGAVQQIASLLSSGQRQNAALIARMEAVPSAVWLTGETQAQVAMGAAGERQANMDVAEQVRKTLHRATLEGAVPVFVAYNIPGRDCSQYSAGGAPTDAAYQAWIDAIGNALGNAKAVLIEEPDGLANLPGYCGSAYNSAFPNITNTSRVDDVAFDAHDFY